jgi:hypothetical protein
VEQRQHLGDPARAAFDLGALRRAQRAKLQCQDLAGIRRQRVQHRPWPLERSERGEQETARIRLLRLGRTLQRRRRFGDGLGRGAGASGNERER